MVDSGAQTGLTRPVCAAPSGSSMPPEGATSLHIVWHPAFHLIQRWQKISQHTFFSLLVIIRPLRINHAGTDREQMTFADPAKVVFGGRLPVLRKVKTQHRAHNPPGILFIT